MSVTVEITCVNATLTATTFPAVSAASALPVLSCLLVERAWVSPQITEAS